MKMGLFFPAVLSVFMRVVILASQKTEWKTHAQIVPVEPIRGSLIVGTVSILSHGWIEEKKDAALAQVFWRIRA